MRVVNRYFMFTPNTCPALPCSPQHIRQPHILSSSPPSSTHPVYPHPAPSSTGPARPGHSYHPRPIHHHKLSRQYPGPRNPALPPILFSSSSSTATIHLLQGEDLGEKGLQNWSERRALKLKNCDADVVVVHSCIYRIKS